jgi:hypothetical protein
LIGKIRDLVEREWPGQWELAALGTNSADAERMAKAGVRRGIQDNYLAELVHITSFERGVVEFFRELPGLLVVLLFAVMCRLSENRVFKIGMVFMTYFGGTDIHI